MLARGPVGGECSPRPARTSPPKAYRPKATRSTSRRASALADLAKTAGDIDILVNAAGVNLRQPYAEVTPEAFDLHMALHLRAPFLLVQHLSRRAWRRGAGGGS